MNRFRMSRVSAAAAPRQIVLNTLTHKELRVSGESEPFCKPFFFSFLSDVHQANQVGFILLIIQGG